MGSKVKLKGGRGVNQVMIASVSKKGNATKGSVGYKQASNDEREPKRKDGMGADQTYSRRGTGEMMMAATWMVIMAIMTFIVLLEALSPSNRKKNERAIPKNEQGDCLSCCANLKIETWMLNVADVAMYNNAIIERIMRALDLKANVWPWIEVRRSRKKIGKSRRNTIGFLDNDNG